MAFVSWIQKYIYTTLLKIFEVFFLSCTICIHVFEEKLWFMIIRISIELRYLEDKAKCLKSLTKAQRQGCREATSKIRDRQGYCIWSNLQHESTENVWNWWSFNDLAVLVSYVTNLCSSRERFFEAFKNFIALGILDVRNIT